MGCGIKRILHFVSCSDDDNNNNCNMCNIILDTAALVGWTIQTLGLRGSHIKIPTDLRIPSPLLFIGPISVL